MMATTTRAAALTDWREQIGILISVAGASALAIAGVLIAIVRKLLEQHRASRERLTLEKQRLDRAVNNMTQGLLLFDAERRLVICNQRYIEMYGLSAEVVKPGSSFHDIIAHRKATGSFSGDIGDYVVRVLRDIHVRNSMVVDTSDGRSIHILNEPLADGGWVATHEDVTERRRIEERITHLAHYDALTDLPNRTMFHEHLRAELAAIAGGEEIAVHYIDIDEFKGVNDALGHLVGDELLKSIATSLSRCAGPHGLRGAARRRRIRHRPERGDVAGAGQRARRAGLRGHPRAVRLHGPSSHHRRQYRHRAGAATRHRAGPDPEERGHGDVRRQGRRTPHLSLLRAGDGCQGPRAAAARDRSAPRHRPRWARRRARGLLPALPQP